MTRKFMRYAALTAASGIGLAALSAQTPAGPAAADHPSFEADGSVKVPAFTLPPSPYVSQEALALQKSLHERNAPRPMPAIPAGLSPIMMTRQGAEAIFAPRAQDMLRRYPADVADTRMGGVRVRVVTPKGVAVDPARVLINVHGGGFNACAENCPVLESAPIASLSGFRVVSIDYRMAPEHVFPAASQDVEAVYRELLKTYKPGAIGMYGCSAGGALSAQAAAWLPAHGLPQLGAIGIFGSGALRGEGGDSVQFARLADGLWRSPRFIRPEGAPPATPPATPPAPIRSYFEGANPSDPMVSPANDPTVLRKFPPTLLITGTRAADMSPAVVTHSRLLDAGVKSQIIVGEGMGHCYIYEPQLPEAQFAYRMIAKFFRDNLR
jgi:epsilon-lactone hydrolase